MLGYWVKAIAAIVKKGKCSSNAPVACEACCKDAYGGYVSGCNVDDCKTECIAHEREYVKVTAEAAISARTLVDSGRCTAYGSIDYENFYYKYHSEHVRAASSQAVMPTKLSRAAFLALLCTSVPTRSMTGCILHRVSRLRGN